MFNLIFLLYFYILFSIMSYFFQSYFFCFYFFNRNYIRLFMILMNKNIKYHLNGGGHFGVNHFLKFLFLSLIMIFYFISVFRLRAFFKSQYGNDFLFFWCWHVALFLKHLDLLQVSTCGSLLSCISYLINVIPN